MKMRTASLGAWRASPLEMDASLSGAFGRNDVSFVVFDVNPASIDSAGRLQHRGVDLAADSKQVKVERPRRAKTPQHL
jgi:hypothetical protein